MTGELCNTTKFYKICILNYKSFGLPVEIMHVLILNGASHTPKVCHIADRLKVSAAQHQANFNTLSFFNFCDDIVDFVNFSVSAPNNSNVHFDTQLMTAIKN